MDINGAIWFTCIRGLKFLAKSNLSNSKLFFPCRKSLIATVEKQLLGEHLTAILQKGNCQFINQITFKMVAADN